MLGGRFYSVFTPDFLFLSSILLVLLLDGFAPE
jgi:hypothetical protein